MDQISKAIPYTRGYTISPECTRGILLYVESTLTRGLGIIFHNNPDFGNYFPQ